MSEFTTFRSTPVLKPHVGFDKLIDAKPGLALPEYVRNLYLVDIVPDVFGGTLKRWTGTEWVKAKLITYDGGSWVKKNLNVYKEGAWQHVDSI